MLERFIHLFRWQETPNARKNLRDAYRNPEKRINSDSIPGLDKPAKLAQYGNKCAYCRVDLDTVKLEWDHAIAHSNQGANHGSNMVPACARCNGPSMKWDKDLAEFCAEMPNHQPVSGTKRKDIAKPTVYQMVVLKRDLDERRHYVQTHNRTKSGRTTKSGKAQLARLREDGYGLLGEMSSHSVFTIGEWFEMARSDRHFRKVMRRHGLPENYTLPGNETEAPEWCCSRHEEEALQYA